MRLTFMTLR